MLRGARSDMAPGIRQVEAQEATRAGQRISRMIAVELSEEFTGAELAVPPAGVWTPEHLADMMLREEGLAAVLLADEPAPDTDPLLRGLNFGRGTLWSWPATAAPLLVVSPEGRATMLDAPTTATALVKTGDGVEAAIANVNGPPVEGMLALYRGAFDGRTAPGAAWPAGTLAMPLRAGPANKRPDAAVWDESLAADERIWWPGTPQPLAETRLGIGEWALVIPPSVAAETREALARTNNLSLHVPLPPRVALAHFAVQADAWWMRAGEKVGTESDALPVETILATDEDGALLLLAQNGAPAGVQFAFPGDQYAVLLRQEGATEALALAGGGERLLVRPEQRANELRGTGARARLAIVAIPRAPRLDLGGTLLDRVQIAWATGSDANERAHPPHGVMDGRLTGGEALDHFWAAAPVALSGSESEKPWLEIGLVQPVIIEAVDLFHIETSGFSPRFNLAGYRLLGRENNQRPWVVLARVSHDTPVARERLRLAHPQPIERLRLEVEQANFLPGGETARLAEIVVWGRPAPRR